MKNGLDVMLNKLQISEKEVVSLKVEKQKLQHELKNTKYTSLASVRDKKNENKIKLTFVKAAANKNSANSNKKLVKVLIQKQIEKKKNATVKKIHLLPPSVQKAPRQAPNSHHAKSHQKVPPSPNGNPSHMKRRFQQMHRCQGVYIFCHGSVDTPIDGVDTGSESLKVFHEDRVKCVDTAPGSVDTSPRFQKT
ncbi:hypothetical protein Taro_043865 [Colocasia esculenta]|uniref:Uncharacterized protein n=1 Tax=Colocasia esculenta TaxID=4460 RepID=A0A843X2B9_COLES|nr:hypothetical protein [Colocasia esculenta]